MSKARHPDSEVVGDSEHRRLLNASLSSISSLMGLQLFSRLFTFTLNQASSRLASPQVFGTAAIQFEFLLSTILFLSREGVRNAILRSRSQNHDRELTENLTLLPSILGLPLMFLTIFIYERFAGETTKNQPYFRLATWLYAFAAMIELLSEPMHAQ
jgi:oligosaccharide translocation protein RFT1